MSATNRHFDKVVVENAGGKREKFGLYHDVNTSMDFGELQPLCCRLLVPGSKTTMSARHLVRLDPMVAPTFGRLKQKTWHHFVGMSELTRKFSALLGKQRVTGAASNQFFTQSDLPFMDKAHLWAFILLGADYSVYCHTPDSTEGPDDAKTSWTLFSLNDSSTAATDLRSWVTSNFNASYLNSSFPGFSGGAVDLHALIGSQYGSGSWMPCGRAVPFSFFHRTVPYSPASPVSSTGFSEVPLSKADFVFRHDITVGSNSYSIAVAVRLSAFGKRLRKIFIGCGYGQPNFLDLSQRSVMPLFAYYKAYFDAFGLCLYDSWESSYAKLILERFDSSSSMSFGLNFSGSPDDGFFARFIVDLANSFYTEDYDYVSAHTLYDTSGHSASFSSTEDKSRGFVSNIVLNTPNSTNGLSGIDQLKTAYSYNETGHVYINRVNHTEVDARLLKLLYRWTNRETAAGRRIAELLRAGGFGKYVDEQKSNFIGYEELDIEITDINATADSSNTQVGANSVLGEYVGKGIGVSKGDVKTFSFENDEFGYWITLSCIVPESGFCQGEDLLNSVTSADDFYSRDFDAVGMELEPNCLLLNGTDWQNSDNSPEEGWYAASFGMVPRHTKWKVKQNICNGDISLASTRDANLPFVLDKWIGVGSRDCVDVTPAGVTSQSVYSVVKNLDVTALPVSGMPWRFLNRYPWLNNFVRIFADFGSDSIRFQDVLHGVLTMGTYEYTHYAKDHFNCFNAIDMVTYAPMKAISESYGTFDDDKPAPDETMSRA